MSMSTGLKTIDEEENGEIRIYIIIEGDNGQDSTKQLSTTKGNQGRYVNMYQGSDQEEVNEED